MKKYVSVKEDSGNFSKSLVKNLSGFEDEAGVKMELEVEGVDQDEFVETESMSPLELACARGNVKMVRYFVDELNLRSKNDFCIDHKTKNFEEMNFIYVPLVNKNLEMVELLLGLAHLWSYDEL